MSLTKGTLYCLPQFERIWRDLPLFLVVNDEGTGVFDPVLVNRWGELLLQILAFGKVFLLLLSASWCARVSCKRTAETSDMVSPDLTKFEISY